MIGVQSMLKPSDNSGAKKVRCIKVYGGGNDKILKATIGDLILVSVREYRPLNKQKNKYNIKKKILRKMLFKALVIRVKRNIKRDFEIIKSTDNAIVLLKLNNSIMCTKIFGPVFNELRQSHYMKIIQMSEGLI